jgi:hypothetical protein
MKLSKTFLMGILALTLVFGMTLAGCDNGSTSSSGGGGDPGVGSLTITGFKAEFNDKTVRADAVKGTHSQLQDYKFEGGVKTATGAIDGSESLTVKSGQLVVPVIGRKGGSEYAFTAGTYTLGALTINNVAVNGLSATFDAAGKGTANVAGTTFAP